MQHRRRRHTTTLKTPQTWASVVNYTFTEKIQPRGKATYQNLANSNVINIKIARLWEDGNCCINQWRKWDNMNTCIIFNNDSVLYIVHITDSPQACAIRLARKSSLPYCLLMTAVRIRDVASLTSWRFLAEEHTQSGRISRTFLQACS